MTEYIISPNSPGIAAQGLFRSPSSAIPFPQDASSDGVSSVSSVSSPEDLPRDVSAFPVQSLPAVARQVVKEGVASLGCPPDLIGVPLLSITGGVIGNRVHVELRPSWRERANLWSCIVGNPGTAKSPALGILQSCLDALQKEAHELHLKKKREHEQALDRWQGEDKATRGPRPTPPKDEQHFYSTDSTIEGVTRMLGGEGSVTPGVTIFRDEIVGWVRSFDAYRTKGGDRQTFLSLWGGASLKSDRAGRDSQYVPEPVVCVCGGIQPDVLPALAPEAGQRDGFVERFLFGYPDTKPMRWTDSTIQQSTLDRLTATFRMIRLAPQGTVLLSPEARDRFAGWVNENAAAQEQVSGLIQGYYAKLPSQAARIALVLHCLEYPENPSCHLLSLDSLQAALDLTEYFRIQAHRTFTHFGEHVLVSHPVSSRVLSALNGDWTTKTDLHQHLGGHIHAHALQHALGELERLGLIEGRITSAHYRDRESRGGRPRQEWRHKKNIQCEETEETEETDGATDEEVLEWRSLPLA